MPSDGILILCHCFFRRSLVEHKKGVTEKGGKERLMCVVFNEENKNCMDCLEGVCVNSSTSNPHYLTPL